MHRFVAWRSQQFGRPLGKNRNLSQLDCRHEVDTCFGLRLGMLSPEVACSVSGRCMKNHILPFLHVCMCMWICMYAYIVIYIYKCMCICMCACTNVGMYVCMHARVYVCVCVYTSLGRQIGWSVGRLVCRCVCPLERCFVPHAIALSQRQHLHLDLFQD